MRAVKAYAADLHDVGVSHLRMHLDLRVQEGIEHSCLLVEGTQFSQGVSEGLLLSGNELYLGDQYYEDPQS